MTSRSSLLRCLSVLVGALVFIVVGPMRPAHGDEPECVDDWPNPDSCYPDILCNEYADFWDVRRAIVHIYGPDIFGTGVLINNALCDDFGKGCGVAYILTAYHIGSGAMGVEMTKAQENTLQNEAMFTFGLEAAWCGSDLTAGGAVGIKGVSIIEKSVERDVLLLRLAVNLPEDLGAYFVGWGQGTLDEQAVVIGHPCNATKRIAISEPGAVKELQEVVHKSIYEVLKWEVGALAYSSSGSPLLDMNTLSLHGLYTHTNNKGVQACFHPEQPDEDIFTALPSILDTLPKFIDGNHSSIDAYDSNPENLIDGTVEDGNYYGKGTTKKISAKLEVVLIDGFYADKGSEITIEVKP